MRNSLSESPIPLNAAKVRKKYYSHKFLCKKMQETVLVLLKPMLMFKVFDLETANCGIKNIKFLFYILSCCQITLTLQVEIHKRQKTQLV